MARFLRGALAALALIVCALPALAQGLPARFIDPSVQFFNSTGSPLAAGTLTFFKTGSSQAQNTYSNSALTIANANPVVLDSSGRAGNIFLLNLPYKVVLADANGVQIWTADPVQPGSGFDVWGGTSTGSANAYVVSGNLGLVAYSAPTAMRFVANFTNTGDSTVNLNTIGALHFFKDTNAGPALLTGNEIIANNLVIATYDPALNANAGGFHLLNPANLITNSQLANMAALTVKANNTGASAAPADVAIAALLRSYLAGLTLSNDSGTPNSVLDIAPGSASDSTNAAFMTLGTFTKSTGGAWTAGTGQNGMGQGLTVANTTWYDACLANNGGTPDIFFDTAVSGQTPCAQHRPTAITDTKVRRLGSILTDGAAHIIAFTQRGDNFSWNTLPTLDINDNALSTTPKNYTLADIPPGVVVEAAMNVTALVASANAGVYIYPLTNTDQAASFAATPQVSVGVFANGAASVQGMGQVRVFTNTAQQVRAVAQAAGHTLQAAIVGYNDTRGRFN